MLFHMSHNILKHVFFSYSFIQFVIIDPKARRSNTIPDWWRQKYNKFKTAQNQALRMKNLIEPRTAFKYQVEDGIYIVGT